MELQYLNGLGCGPEKQAYHNYIDFEEDDLEGNWEGQAYNKRSANINGMGRVNLGTTLPPANCNCQVTQEEMNGILQDIGNGISNVVKGAVNVVKDVGQKIADVATNVANAVTDAAKVVVNRIASIAKDVVRTFAKIFPATVLVRTAFLTALKLNILNLARRLRWAYTPKDWFVSQGGDPGQYDKMMKVRHRIEDIFYWAGGNVENVEEAIKTGKGNSVNPINWGAFSGFGSVDAVQDTRDLNPGMSIREILGEKMFNEELSRGNLDGSVTTLGELGDVASVIGTIMPILTAITQLINAIASLKGKGAANPALTSDMDPSLTTAPENNLSDMSYVNSYTSAMQNTSSNMEAFSDVQAAIGTNSANNAPAMTYQPSTQPQNTTSTTPVTQVSYTEPTAAQNTAAGNSGSDDKKSTDSWLKRNQTAILITTGIAVAGGVTWAVIAHNNKMKKQKLLQAHRLNGPGRKRRSTSQNRPRYSF